MEMIAQLQDDPQNYKTTGVAARVGDLVGLQTMIWSGRPVDVFDNRGWSPLHEAAAKGYSGCLEFLLRQKGVDPDWVTHRRETALLLAARNGHYQCLRALVNAKADVNLVTNEGFSPLYEAIAAKSNDCIRLLVKKESVINHVVYTGYTPLHQAASMGNAVVTACLLQQGALQNIRCHDGLTPLFLAVQSGSVDTVHVLLNRLQEADNAENDVVNMAADDNATPLLIAAQDGHDEIINLLLHHGADPNIQVTDTKAGPLQYAIYCNRTKCVRKLLPVTDLLMFDNDFGVMHPLVQTLGRADTSMLEELLEAGLNPEGSRPLDQDQVEELQELTDGVVEADWKASLLCHIPREGNLNAARCLLERGLSPNAQQDKEVPPLLAAMARRNVPLVQYLLQHGANPNVYSATLNITMLFALHCDLQGSSIAEDAVTDAASGDNAGDPMVVDSQQDRHQWLEQSKGSFFMRLFAAGGEVESLLRNPVVSGWRLQTVLQMNLGQPMTASVNAVQRRQGVVAALLYLLLCLSYGVDSLHDDFVPLVTVDQAKELNAIAEKSGTLAHLCRKWIFRHLCGRKESVQESVASLGLPAQVADYLLFPELESHSRTLSAVGLFTSRLG